jgi:hypothetical protein
MQEIKRVIPFSWYETRLNFVPQRLVQNKTSELALITIMRHILVKNEYSCWLETLERLSYRDILLSSSKVGNTSDYVGYEIFTGVTMKNAVFWDVAPGRSYEINRRFGVTYRLLSLL